MFLLCPIRSINSETYCGEDCQWFINAKNPKYDQCGIMMYFSIMASRLSAISENIETLCDSMDSLKRDINSIEDSLADMVGKTN